MSPLEIKNKVREIIYKNMISGYSDSVGVSYHYTQPSQSTYPFQYFWDTCFHAFILCSLGEYEMAKKHLISLFALQEKDGFVGHILYWKGILPARITDIFQSKPSLKLNLFRTHMSALIQPPLAAQTVWRVYQCSKDKDFLKSMHPKLKAYYQWIADNRDFDQDGLVSIISPFESGMDWKVTYDPVIGFSGKKADWRLFLKVIGIDFRNFYHNYNLKTISQKDYFRVKDAGFNTIYAQNLQTLGQICKELNDPDDKTFEALADKVIESMLRVMYDDETAAFYDVYGKLNTKIKVLTPTVFFPVVLQNIPDVIIKKIVDSHFFNDEEFNVPFPIPSVAKNHASFNPGQSLFIWRGPTWIVFNWFMHQFLMEKGYRKESKRLITSIEKLIEKSGFREYYNPFTGEGYGACDFTWAGLIIDMINMEKDRDIMQKVPE